MAIRPPPDGTFGMEGVGGADNVSEVDGVILTPQPGAERRAVCIINRLVGEHGALRELVVCPWQLVRLSVAQWLPP